MEKRALLLNNNQLAVHNVSFDVSFFSSNLTLSKSLSYRGGGQGTDPGNKTQNYVILDKQSTGDVVTHSFPLTVRVIGCIDLGLSSWISPTKIDLSVI